MAYNPNFAAGGQNRFGGPPRAPNAPQNRPGMAPPNAARPPMMGAPFHGTPAGPPRGNFGQPSNAGPPRMMPQQQQRQQQPTTGQRPPMMMGRPGGPPSGRPPMGGPPMGGPPMGRPPSGAGPNFGAPGQGPQGGPPTAMMGNMQLGPSNAGRMDPPRGPPGQGAPGGMGNNSMPRGPPNMMMQQPPRGPPKMMGGGAPGGVPQRNGGGPGMMRPPNMAAPPSARPGPSAPPTQAGSWPQQQQMPPQQQQHHQQHHQQQHHQQQMPNGLPQQQMQGSRPMARRSVKKIDPKLQCDPVYLAPSVKLFPKSPALARKCGVPLGVVLQPLAENPEGEDVPTVNFGTAGVIRCRQCRTYINPFVTFIDNGRRWTCNMCRRANEVPSPYFCHLDASGKRRDVEERPELCKGQVEYVAPQEYMVRPPQPPVYLFVIDVSYNSVATGLLHHAVATIKSLLNELPGSPRTQVGFITFDTTVHFYNLRSTLNSPQMMVCPDPSDAFLPIPEDLLVNLSESANIVANLLDVLPDMFKSNRTVDTSLGLAVEAGFQVMGNIGGKMCVFQSCLPKVGKGSLRPRENPRALGTAEENKLLAPVSDLYYKTEAIKYSRQQICVEMFVACSGYADVATLGCLPKFTGGNMHYYPNFHHARDGDRLAADIRRVLTRETAWEAVARVRVSAGCRISAFYGNYFIRGADLLALPNCSADWTVGINIVHSDAVLQTDSVCIQSALLYTTSRGERRIRVNTIALPVTDSEHDVYRSACLTPLCNLMAKGAADVGLTNGLASARQRLTRQCTDVVRGWSQASQGYGGPQASSNANQAINLPPTLHLLPLNTMSLIKSPALRGGNTIPLDLRSFTMGQLMNMSLEQSEAFVYPRLYALHNLSSLPDAGTLLDTATAAQNAPKGAKVVAVSSGVSNPKAGSKADVPQKSCVMPPQVGLSAAALTSDGAFLLDNALGIFLWFGRAINPNIIQELFGIPGLEGIDTTQLRLNPPGHNSLCDRVNNIVAACRSRRPTFSPITVIQEGGALDSQFFTYLVEDRANFAEGAVTYQEFLQTVQRPSGMGSMPGMPGGHGMIPPSQQRR